MIKKLMEQSIMDTVATTTTTLKSKKFPTMFKKMMLSSKFHNFLIYINIFSNYTYYYIMHWSLSCF